mmetsp:Transcript_106766/g.281637  ORF Transcript_106766/g.281637 Transcript_106766/m.281637 type:complete len:94 (-) Transcript_106766:12-293(-)
MHRCNTMIYDSPWREEEEEKETGAGGGGQGERTSSCADRSGSTGSDHFHTGGRSRSSKQPRKSSLPTLTAADRTPHLLSCSARAMAQANTPRF